MVKTSTGLLDFKGHNQREEEAHRPYCPDFEEIKRLTWEMGYNVALHGSFIRDFDVVAIAWIKEASAPQALIDHLCKGLNARQLGSLENKPNGRVAVSLQITDQYAKTIDLSIIPPLR